MTVSFWSLAYGLAVSVAGTPNEPDRAADAVVAAGVSLALLIMPAGFGAVAVVSRRPDAPLWVLAAMGLSIAIGLPLLALGNPLASLIAGYAAGAVVVVSLPADRSWPPRAVAAAAVTMATVVGMSIAFVLVAFVAPALPFVAPLIADTYSARRDSTGDL